MSEVKLGQEPAFPFLTHNENGYGDTVVLADLSGNKIFLPFEKGISKRLYLAGMAMQGLISAQSVYKDGIDAEWTAKTAFNCADQLLIKENE